MVNKRMEFEEVQNGVIYLFPLPNQTSLIILLQSNLRSRCGIAIKSEKMPSNIISGIDGKLAQITDNTPNNQNIKTEKAVCASGLFGSGRCGDKLILLP